MILVRLLLSLAYASLPLLFLAAVLLNADWRSLLERHGSAALGRRLTASAVALRWDDGPRLTIADLQVAAPRWGSAPIMVSAARVEVALDAGALARGQIVLRQLTLERPRVTLERGPGRRGNWVFGEPSPSQRPAFRPLVLNARVTDGEVTYRTSRGQVIRIAASSLVLGADSLDAPLRLEASGRYNGTPLRLLATLPRAADQHGPSPVTVEVSLDDATARFAGDMDSPLDADGATGRLSIEAARLAALLWIFGLDAPHLAGREASLQGSLHRAGDHWRLTDSRGAIASSRFTGDIRLDEGRAGAPDRLGLDVAFQTLDLEPLLGPAGPPQGWRRTALALPANPDPVIDARLRAPSLSVGGQDLTAIAFAGRYDAAGLEASRFGFGIAEGRVTGMGTLRPATGGGARVTLRAEAAGLRAAALARLADAGTLDLDGRVDATVTLDASGATLGAALAAGRGHVAASVTRGRIARALLERASIDLRTLFRDGEGDVALRCVLAAGVLRGGILALAPLRLISDAGALTGGGEIDLLRDRIDLVFATESASTSSFALDLPVRVSGRLSSPDAGLGSGAALRAVSRGGLQPGAPDNARRLADRSTCLR